MASGAPTGNGPARLKSVMGVFTWAVDNMAADAIMQNNITLFIIL